MPPNVKKKKKGKGKSKISSVLEPPPSVQVYHLYSCKIA